jgi:hypothetical protein
MIEIIPTWEAVKSFFLALPPIAWIVQRFLKRKDAKEAEDASDEANKAAHDLDPDSVGPRLRRGVRRR